MQVIVKIAFECALGIGYELLPHLVEIIFDGRDGIDASCDALDLLRYEIH